MRPGSEDLRPPLYPDDRVIHRHGGDFTVVSRPFQDSEGKWVVDARTPSGAVRLIACRDLRLPTQWLGFLTRLWCRFGIHGWTYGFPPDMSAIRTCRACGTREAMHRGAWHRWEPVR